MADTSWSFLFVPPTVAIGFWLLRKLFPASAEPENDEGKTKEVPLTEEQFKKYSGWGAVLWFTLWPLNWFLLTVLFSSFGTLWNANRFPEASFALTAWWVIYLFPAFLLSFLSTYYSLNWAWRLIIGERNYQEYNSYYIRLSGINWQSLMRPCITRPLQIIVILSSIIAFLVVVNWYVLFTPEFIVINSSFSRIKCTWRYSDIESIQTAPVWIDKQGKIIPRREYLITFHDHQKWMTTDAYGFPNIYRSPASLTPKQKTKILAYVSKKAWVPIMEMKVLNLNLSQ